MAPAANTPNKKSRQEWIQEHKDIAQRQLSRIPDLSKALFGSPDITPFLRLLSRLPYYNFQNLLIIYDKYPEASVLTSFPAWQSMLSPAGKDQKVLKPEGIGKGIELVLPFFEMIGENDRKLTWYSVLVFDIRQTNVQNYTPRPPVYIHDTLHLSYLLEAVKEVIPSCYNRRVILEPRSDTLIDSGIPGRITSQIVSLLRGTKDEDALFWLTEALCTIAVEDPQISAQAKALLREYAHFCLYALWGISHPGILPGSHRSLPEQVQLTFLDLLQRTVFHLHQKVAGFYLHQRKEAQSFDEDL